MATRYVAADGMQRISNGDAYTHAVVVARSGDRTAPPVTQGWCRSESGARASARRWERAGFTVLITPVWDEDVYAIPEKAAWAAEYQRFTARWMESLEGVASSGDMVHTGDLTEQHDTEETEMTTTTTRKCRRCNGTSVGFRQVGDCYGCNGMGQVKVTRLTAAEKTAEKVRAERLRTAREAVSAHVATWADDDARDAALWGFNRLRDNEPKRMEKLLASVENGRVADVAAHLVPYYHASCRAAEALRAS